jgi:hypothetical protein
MTKRTLYILILLSFSVSAQSPKDPSKLWSSAGLRVKLAKKMNAEINQMYGFDSAPVTLRFTQTSARIQYSPGGHLSFSAGWLVTKSLRRQKPVIHKYRYTGSVAWRSKIEIWRLTNSIKIELFDIRETRYDKRIIYSFYIKPKTMKMAPKIKWSPFINMRFYYNMGGKAISQYNNEGARIGKFTPDGLHRLRLKSGVYFKLFKKLKITLQGTYQEEFNTIWSVKNNQNINVRNPKSGNITRRFQNYFVLSISAKWYLSLWSLKRHAKNDEDDHDLDNQ